MFWITLILILMLTYSLLSVLIFFVINSNFIPSRRHQKYDLTIPAVLKYMDEDKTAYWEAIQTDLPKNVILLHGFTRNSGKMNKRANLWWKWGYNVYLIDNRGHGLSRNILFPSGFQYSFIVRKLIKEKSIENPILHGASMGAIAAAYVAQKEPKIPKFIICEALPHDFDNLYHEIMNFMKIPVPLFFWLDWVSRKIVWRQFEGLDAEYDLSDIKVPLFLIHGEDDLMFKPEIHYDKIVELMKQRQQFESWLVPESKHTRMDGHPAYEAKIQEFLGNVTLPIRD